MDLFKKCPRCGSENIECKSDGWTSVYTDCVEADYSSLEVTCGDCGIDLFRQEYMVSCNKF